MLMLNKKITPENALETAVLNKDNSAIVDLIADGAFLTRPDILATKESFDLHFDVVMLLIESAPCLRSESAVKRLEELGANPEMLDLVRETALPLEENDHPQSDAMIEAIAKGDEETICDLIINEDVTLHSADLKIFDSLSGFSEETVVLLLDHGLFGRLKAQIFLDLREKAQQGKSDRDVLLFEIMKTITKEFDSDKRKRHIHWLWEKYTYIKTIAAEPEKYTDGCLAWLIIDELLDFKVRPFKAFAPYYQALLLNNGCVTSEQFEKEAEIEKFDAKAVFELLSHNGKYADRINWELVNKTAKARNLLEFLDEHPQYADKADWQMLTTQVDSGDWIMFLKNHPDLLEKHQNHAELYCDFHMFWEEDILPESGIPYGNCFAAIILDYPDFNYCFKVRINDGKAEFFEISDPGTYQKYAELAEKDFDAFCKTLKNPGWDKESTPDLYDDGNEYFVPVIR